MCRIFIHYCNFYNKVVLFILLHIFLYVSLKTFSSTCRINGFSNYLNMLKSILNIFFRSNGILLLHKHELNPDIRELIREISIDSNMKTIKDDRANLRKDVENLKKELKKSYSAYKSEFVNG